MIDLTRIDPEIIERAECVTYHYQRFLDKPSVPNFNAYEGKRKEFENDFSGCDWLKIAPVIKQQRRR